MKQMRYLDDLPAIPTGEEPVMEDVEVISETQKRVSVPLALVESDVELALEREAIKLGAVHGGKAYRMYLDGKSALEIATSLAEYGVTPDAVVQWARDGDWAQRLRRKNDARELLVRESIRSIRLSKAEEDVESSLRIGKRIREVVEKKLEDPDSLRTQDIKNLAEAGKASSDTSARGMGESASDDPAGGGKGGGKTPLVMIFPGGGLPPMPKNVEVVTMKGTEG